MPHPSSRLRAAALLPLLVLGLALTACTDESQPPPPTATPTTAPPVPTATPNAVGIAVSKIASISKYRYTLDVTGKGISVDAHLEGDYFNNDGLLKGTVGGIATEQLIVDQRVYIKDNEDNWVRLAEAKRTPIPGSENQVVSADSLTANPHPLRAFSPILQAAAKLEDKGEETLHGIKVRKIDFQIDAERFFGESTAALKEQHNGTLPSLGNGTVWIDPSTQFLHKYTVSIDLARYTELSNLEAALGYSTPTPGGPAPSPVPASSLTIALEVRDHNDPAIVVPDAPPSPTPNITPLETPTTAP